MPYFDRFDICEAYLVMEWDWNYGGWLQERKSNQRRREATHVQLNRMEFRISPIHNGYESLTDNGKEIYYNLCKRYGFGFPTEYSLPYADEPENLYELGYK